MRPSAAFCAQFRCLGWQFVPPAPFTPRSRVTLSPSPAGPQPVGTIITWTATVQDTEQGTHEYQFSVGPVNGPLAIVRDFDLPNTLPWAFSKTEGTYKVKVVVQQYFQWYERQGLGTVSW